MTDYPLYLCSAAHHSDERLEVVNPFRGDVVGRVATIHAAQLDEAIAHTRAQSFDLSRHDRATILETACGLLQAKRDEFARLITAEAGLCLRDAEYEVGRASDVLRFAAIEALRDDGQIFSCDVTAARKARKIYTTRSPLRLVGAITPFNHPLNQVAHKVAPAIAAGAPMVLKPSEKTPLTAVRFAELLYEAGLPPAFLSVVLGTSTELAEHLVGHPDVDLLSFTGSVAIGKRIATIAGYKKLCLELGGNSPLLVLEDADLDLAVRLAAEGAFRNSGQRCTAVKRILVDRRVVEPFTAALVEAAREYVCADPADPATRVGTVIDADAATVLERRVEDAVERGAQLLLGGIRHGALLQPAVLADVPRDAEMVVQESFGPLAPIVPCDGLDDAIEFANSAPFGLAAGVVTRNMESAIRAIQELETATVNINDVPGYRLENSPFGGIKDSGLGIKEGVVEAMKFMTYVKTYSLPW